MSVTPEVANYLSNEMRADLMELERSSGKQVHIDADSLIGQGQYQLRFLSGEGREVKPKKG